MGIALYGFGTVGTALQRVLRARRAEVAERYGVELVLRHVIVRDPARQRQECHAPARLGTEWRAPLRDPRVDIVVEAMGGIEPAGSVVAAALRDGKAVVTANKALIAARGPELEALAAAHGAMLRYEAAVGGAIPILHALRGALVANHVARIRGILNGTCNYILTRMSADGVGLDEALRDAQALGFAEADPTLDISGQDSAHKLQILARHAFGAWVDGARVACQGIERVSLAAAQEARRAGAMIRLVAEATRGDAGLTLRVAPVAVAPGDALHAVSGEMNAVEVTGDFAGLLLFVGAGAGGDATASAVFADVVEVARARAVRRPPVVRVPQFVGAPSVTG